ncbi:MAG: hypothetical protein QOK44_5938, partial [Betaproteobacteria bacterium]|nr:hypothetical protein [Betaproteobacteria bacterium]
MPRVGVIGAGLMGTAVAQRLIAAGFEVLAYDIDGDKRVSIARTGASPIAEVGTIITACEVIVVCVFNTEQVEDVIAGPGGGVDAITQGGTVARLFIVTSTCDPERLARLAERVEPSGVQLLEAPISGTSRQVAQGDGVGLVGGDR